MSAVKKAEPWWGRAVGERRRAPSQIMGPAPVAGCGMRGGAMFVGGGCEVCARHRQVWGVCLLQQGQG